MTRTRRAVGLLATLTLTVTACGGSDASETDGGDASTSETDEASTTDEAEPEESSDEAALDLPAVEVPAGWDPSVPTDPIEGMTLTFAGVRGEGDQAIYELQYDGTGQDGVALFDAYEMLALAAGWTEAEQATSLIGSFSMGDRTLVITSFGGDSSQIIVSAAPN